MGDELEKFVLDNKESFNEDVPSERAWKGIETKLDGKKKVWPMLWKAAAVVFMISTVYLMVDKVYHENDGPTFSDEFTQAEDYYINLISLKRQEIKEQLTPEQHQEFLIEIDQLDQMYAELKKTYNTNASNGRVMDAMISNLQLRIDILNKQLEILKNIKNQENENDISIEI